MTTLKVIIDGQTCEVPVGMSIAAALALVGNGVTRRSVSGQLRAPFCGMGVPRHGERAPGAGLPDGMPARNGD